MTNTLQASTPEVKAQSEVSEALQRATRTVAELDSNLDFQAYLSDTNQNLDYDDSLSFWQTTANYTKTYLSSHEELTLLDKESYVVVTNLPAAMIASYRLERHQGQLDSQQSKACKRTICSYNQLVKHFVTAFPQNSEALHKELLDAVLQTVGADSIDFSNHTEATIDKMFKGVRHEIGFARLLDRAGIPYRESTIEEDLKGKDIVIQFNGNDIGVDIKASLSEVEAQNKGASGSPYAIKPDGNIVMYSMMLDSHFDKGFEPNEDRLEEIEDTARGIIGSAVVEAIAKSNI